MSDYLNIEELTKCYTSSLSRRALSFHSPAFSRGWLQPGVPFRPPALVTLKM
jgi:hypothetical protein